MFFKSLKDPYKLDWGALTPEGYDAATNTIMHVFNVDISSPEKIERCIIFATGKIIWSVKHIPVGTNQKVVFDLRGQPITFLDKFRKMKAQVLQNVEKATGGSSIIIEALI